MSLTENTSGIKATMIIEIIGRPPEHLTKTLKNMIKEMGKEKGIKITGEKTKDPVLMKDQKDFYTSFAEVEVELETVMDIAKIMFKYMPAHIEILSPERLQISNNDLNEVFNEIARRLHGYDEVARVIQAEKTILENKLRDLLEKKDDKKP